MTALEGVLRRALSLYDPPQPPGHREPRQLGPREGKLPRWLKEPHGPDEIVFGDWRPPPPEDACTGIYRTCRDCGVTWRGYSEPCWACGKRGETT